MKIIILILIALPFYAFTQGNPYANISKPLDAGFVSRSSMNIETPNIVGHEESGTLDNIQGTLFYKKEFEKGMLYTNASMPIRIDSCRINLYSNSLYYKYAGKEYVAGSNIIKKIIVGNDSTKAKYFINIVDPVKGTDQFYEQLNEGKIQLLKKYTKSLATKDSLFNTIKVPFINTKETLYFYVNGNLNVIYHGFKKVLDDLGLLTEFNIKWLKTEKNKLKTEKSVLLFLDYINKNK